VATNVSISINLKYLSKDLVSAVIRRTALKCQLFARRYAPVDTGALRLSITAVSTEKEATVYSDMEYAVEQEYGDRSGKKFTPYMRPAAQLAGSQVEVDKSTIAEFARLTK